MPVKIRLTRHGRKRKPFYHIVIADSRAPRDGRYIERIGNYNPNTNPASIELDFDRALEWLQKGAQPTDTCRAILSYKGVLYKNHLLNGVKKEAFSAEEAEKRFHAWLKEKEDKIQAKKDLLADDANKLLKERLDAETKVNEARAQEIALEQSKLAEEIARAEAPADETAKDPEVQAAPAADKTAKGPDTEVQAAPAADKSAKDPDPEVQAAPAADKTAKDPDPEVQAAPAADKTAKDPDAEVQTAPAADENKDAGIQKPADVKADAPVTGQPVAEESKKDTEPVSEEAKAEEEAGKPTGESAKEKTTETDAPAETSEKDSEESGKEKKS